MENYLEQIVLNLVKDEKCTMKVRKAGIYQFKANYRFDFHSHVEHEINYVRFGSAIMQIDGQDLLLKKGDCVVIPPYKKHSFVVNKQEGCGLVQVEMSLNIPESERPQATVYSVDATYYRISQCEEIVPLMERIARLNRMRTLDDYLKMSLKLTVIDLMISLRYHMNLIDSDNNTQMNAKIQEIIRYIKGHYTEELSIESLCKLHQVSTRYVGRYFRQHLKTSPLEYLTELRITNAKRLLWNTNKSILEIALESGYDSAQYFCRVFKRREAMTPREYRNLWGKEN